MWRWLLGLLLAPVVAVAAYVGYACWAFRDIPAAQIELRYGDPGVRVATVDGVPLHYRVEGSGPALVLIHSQFFDMGIWDAWVKELAPHFTVLRYDLTGHGLTGPDPSGVYTVERDLALLDGLLKQLDIDEVALVGSSIGGHIAFAFASGQPQRVSALVLMNSGGLDRANRRSGDDLPGWASGAFHLAPPALLHKFLRWMIADDALVTEQLRARFVDMCWREGNRAAQYQRLRQYGIGDPDVILARVTAPTLILWGEANPHLPPALAADFEHKLIHAAKVQTKIYPGAGHVLPLERPQESAADTLSFLLANQTP